MTSAPWLQQHLIAEGHVTEKGLTRTPQQRTCRDCGQRLLAGIDRSGFDAWTWAWPTTTTGELAAVLRGVPTWHLSAHGGLIYRSSHTIAAKPASDVAVHVGHRCGDPPPPAASVTATAAAPTYDHPPF